MARLQQSVVASPTISVWRWTGGLGKMRGMRCLSGSSQVYHLAPSLGKHNLLMLHRSSDWVRQVAWSGVFGH